ncbi:MAG: hypothetical protein DHS20C11_11310 [Lysobacteraceae bacterium]|nr:MAG: hypothetical protein DHS20C11_11310 [Xanthomonadaceae bacterium]
MTKTEQFEPKQSRSRRTQARLFDATEQLLRRQAFDDLTVAQITAEAKVSVGTFYRRFANKEALLQQLMEQYWQHDAMKRSECLTAMSQQPDVANRLRIMVAYYITDYTQNAGVLRNIVLRWRLQFATIGGSQEHLATIESVKEMATALVSGQSGIEMDNAIMCVHLVANQCRDFCLFPELLANATLRDWRKYLPDHLFSACIGLLES